MNLRASTLASFSLLACFAAGCSANGDDVASDSAAISANETLVYQHDATVGLNKVEAPETERLFKAAFKNGFLKSQEECSDSKAVRIAPDMNGKMEGSFTGINRKETLYIVNVFGCDSSHAENYGTTRFIVTEPLAATGEVKILANAEIQGAIASVNRILDIDADGQNELVLTEGYSGMGETSESISLMRFAGNNLFEDPAFTAFRTEMYAKESFGFFVDPCYTTEDPSKTPILFANIYVKTVDGKPKFRAQQGTLTCPPQNEETGNDEIKP